jgi:hypothetical protein
MIAGSVPKHLSRRLLLLAGLSVLSFPASAAAPTKVGYPARIEQLWLSGSELEVRPLADRSSPIVLRIVSVYPHGDDFRYDLEYYGLEEGTYDLMKYLRRKDGSAMADLPSLLVTIQSTLPPGQVEPHPLAAQRTPRLGGYQWTMLVLGILWLSGLLAFVLTRHRRRLATADAIQAPLTFADRIRPMVEGAMEGRLSRHEQAELERLLLAFWRRRLNLDRVTAAEAIVALRRHEEAGQLLRQLEHWLHAREQVEQVDIQQLLLPYRHLAAEDAA